MRTLREGRATAAEKEPVVSSDDDERHDDAEHEHEQTREPVGELEAGIFHHSTSAAPPY